jgi:hypothetical protein
MAPSAPADDRVPTEQPEILQPREGLTTGEWEIPVTVAVPADDLPRRDLTLEILRDGETLGEAQRPRPGDVIVEGVRLLEGTNLLTAALRGPGGLGPLSDPVSVVLDRTVAPLTLTAPNDDATTMDSSVVVSGTSEPGATVAIRNASRDWEDPAVVGPSGSFEATVPLVEGKNRIVVISTDEAGNKRRAARTITRQNGRPNLKVTAPKKVRLASLPAKIKLQVEVTDANKRSISGADVVFAVTIPGQSSETNEEQTNDAGRVVWRLPVPKGSSSGDLILVSVMVTAPNGQSRDGLVQIRVS